MELEKICKETIEAVKEAGAYILEAHRSNKDHQLQEKGRHNYVTEIDKAAEEMLVYSLGQIIAGAGFIAEEGTQKSNGEQYQWIIDPLDGTTNFIHGAYPFAVSVALSDKGSPILGVVLELGLNECFYAWKGGGAYMNGEAIKVSDTPYLQDSLIATGFPYTDYNRMDQFMNTIEWFMKNSRGLRRLGSAATDIAWVACGRYDGFYEYGLNAWDVAAGAIILEEAGGRCSDFNGGNTHIFEKEIICSNGKVHQEFTKVVESIMETK